MKILKIVILLFYYGITTDQSTLFSQDSLVSEIRYSQIEVDSMLFNYASGNGKKRLSSEELKILLLTKSNLKGWEQHYYTSKSAQFSNKKEYDSSLFYVNKGINYFNKLSEKRSIDKHLMIRCYNMKGLIEFFDKNYDVSLDYYQKAFGLTKIFPYKWKGYILAGIAQNHLSIGDKKLALQSYLELESDTIYRSVDRAAVVLYSNIGNLFLEKENNNKASSYFKKGLKRSIESEIYKTSLPNLYGSIGNLFYDNQIDSTMFYFKKSIDAYYEYDLKDAYNGIDEDILYREAFVDIYSGRIQDGILKLEELISITKELEIISNDDLSLIKKALELLSKTYDESSIKIDRYEELYLSTQVIFEKALSDQLESKVNKLEVSYQSKEKDASIIQLEEMNKNQELILQQRSIINWILGGFILTLVGGVLLFFKQRKQKNALKLVNLEQRLLRSQLNPHFLFNALSTVSSLSTQKSDQTTTYISSLGKLLRGVLENSREEHISVTEEIETITNYLELQSSFKQKFDFMIHIDNSINKEEVLIPPMFIQPFIENAIEHGFKGEPNEFIKINLKLDRSRKSLLVTIENNGKAYSKSIIQKSKVHRSLSGSILKERLEVYANTHKSKAYFTIEDLEKNVKGAKVNIVLPLILDI